MQPTLSLAWLPSMRDSAISGCHCGSALKSRITDQTLGAGASITVEAYTWITLALLRFPRARLGERRGGRDAADVAAVQADLLQQHVHERRLRAVAQRAVDDVVGHAATAAVAPAAPATAAQPVDVQDADALDALHGFHALAHDALHLLEQAHAQRRGARLRREDVARLVHQAHAVGLDLGADLGRQRADLVGFRLGARLRLERGTAVGGGHLLGLGGLREPQRVALGLLARPDHLDLAAALGNLGLARGEHLLLGRHREGAGEVGLGLRFALGARLPGDGDGALLLGDLELLAAVDLERLQVALLGDAVFLRRGVG